MSKYPEQDIKSHKRLSYVSGSDSIKALIDVAIETLTNSDDEYEAWAAADGRRGYHGESVVKYKQGGKKNPTRVTFADKGRGVRSEKLDGILQEHGGEVVSGGSRGYMHRGLIDIAYAGDVVIESVANGKYSKVKIRRASQKFQFIYKDVDRKTLKDKDFCDLSSKNVTHGFFVTVTIPPNTNPKFNPQPNTLRKQLRHTYALRLMLSMADGKVLNGKHCNTIDLKFIPEGKKPEKINYVEPEVELVEKNREIKFNYFGNEVSASLTLGKSKSILSQDETDTRLTHDGILIVGEKTVHDKNFLKSKHENSPYAKKFTGALRCPYIDDLARDYEKTRKEIQDDHKEVAPDQKNPFLPFDPNRRKGLRGDHPFVQELYKNVRPILDEHIANEIDHSTEKDAVDKETKDMINNALKILEDNEKDSEGIKKGVDGKQPFWVIPANALIEQGETKKIYFYTNIAEMDNQEVVASIEKPNQKYLKITNKKTSFAKSRKEGVSRAIFEVEGKEFDLEKDSSSQNVPVKFHVNSELKAETNIEVYLELELDRSFKTDLEFENNKNTVRYEGNRKIKVFAKHPDITNGNPKAKVLVDNQNIIKNPDTCEFKHIDGSNYSIAEIKISGLKLDGRVTMTVIYNDHRAETVIDVVERDKENKASKYDFELKEEDFGDKKIRALWRETTLIITTSNQFVKSYRGEFDQEKQAGENEKRLYWKIYLTEILADKITEKRIEQDSKLTPDVFSDILHGDSEEAVVAHMQYITTKIRTDILHQLHQQLNVTKARLVDG